MCNMMMMYEQTRSCYCRIGRIKTTEQVQIEYHTQTHTRAKNVGSQNGIDVRTETEKRHTTKDKDGTKKMERNQRARQMKLIVHQMMAYE